jgi:hypothetical protein
MARAKGVWKYINAALFTFFGFLIAAICHIESQVLGYAFG